MISFIVRNKDTTGNRPYSAMARVATRFFDAFAPYICGLEALPNNTDAVRLWIDTNTDQIPTLIEMLTAFINPWTGGQSTVECVEDDYEKYGHPRLQPK